MFNWIYHKKTFLFLTLVCVVNTAIASQGDTETVTLEKYDSNIFLIEETPGITKAKIAQNLNGDLTYGGVTGYLEQLIDFYIPLQITINKNFQTYDSRPRFNIDAELDQNEECNKLRFTIVENKIIALPSNINLNSALNCRYSIFNSERKKVGDFNVLLNYTFSYWCNQSNPNSEAYKTARIISDTCIIDPEKIFDFQFLRKKISDLSPFSGFINLKILNLDGNEISQLPLGILDKFTNLKYLILKNNKIKTLPLGILDKLSRLTWLWLMENEINNLPLGLFDQLESLYWLSLCNNKLNNIPDGLFANLKNLSSMELSNNQLVAFPSDIKKLNKLISIELDSNKIINIPSESFKDHTKLTYLSLSKNQLKTLPADLFKNLKSLSILNLDNNNILYLPIGIFDDLCNLEEIRLDLFDSSALPYKAHCNIGN